MILDHVTLHIKAGDGGNGCVSYRREKYVSHGGPDGGDGGNGGDVIFYIDEGQNTLLFYKYHRKFSAKSGEAGKGGRCHGKNADALRLPVPPGTLIKDAESGKIIKDMSDTDIRETGEYLFAKGGKGGFGNAHFATPTRQTPNFAKSGIIGRETDITLELKLLADAALVGMPSAGKSTILSMVSDAKPKIAEYHFTTLSPILGVVDAKAGGYVLADIPGLIEGASEGEGLGHEFLRHIERCRLIINVIDASGIEGRDPLEDLRVINEELQKFNASFAACPRILVANKMDMVSDEQKEKLQAYADKNGLPIIFMCAAIGEGTEELKELIAQKLKDLPPIKIFEPEYIEPDEPTDAVADESITVDVTGSVYNVYAPRLDKVVSSINYNDYESMAYFQKVLRNAGVFALLEEHGIADGDTVKIGDVEFDYYK